ncbi:hypothetical protein LRAMOSA07532 [Lichtheimia ramosa]|uniref:Uncharacterized protein n=1 Tax=Lichtheimia ramosa TaxID=688394 RepID=A0A077WEL1_9FUNG|nr:hypothetical protein LRAMOSA07532 [Lichtheimia ramosa]
MDSQFAGEKKEIDQNNCVDADNVTLNGFSFCARHGLEVCTKCPTDNRGINNMSVEDMLHEKVDQAVLEKKWKGDDREPFSVAHQWTRLSNGKPGCMTHKEVACPECFNWNEKVLSGIQGAKKTARRARNKARAEKNAAVE